MVSAKQAGPTVIVIFGASGDLTWRKLIPALYNLFLDKWMPEKFMIIGTGNTKMSDTQFRKRLHQGVDKFSRRGMLFQRISITYLPTLR